MSMLGYILVFFILAGLSGSVIWGLWWALRGGQFSNFAAGATSIFDDEEPQGYATDAFPPAKDENKSEEMK